MKNLLSKGEVPGILSMNRYWEEVAEREKPSPEIFQRELSDLVMRIGAKRILLIVGQYAKLLESKKELEVFYKKLREE